MNQQDEQQARPAIPENMVLYYVGFLIRGPNYTTETPETKRLQEAHLAYLAEQRQRGVLLIYGPVRDSSALRGVCVLQTASSEKAEAIMRGDPAVQAGRFLIELHPWMTFKGILPSAP